MNNEFDQIIDRSDIISMKWGRYGDQVLPMWVADMDFASPQPIIDAVQQRAASGVFGYGLPSVQLAELLCERMDQRYDWQITPEQIVYLPGLVCGLNVVCRAIGEPGDAVLTQTPVYPPFLTAPSNQNRVLETVELIPDLPGDELYYEPDYSGLAGAITARTRLFLLCHPHNPVGRVYHSEELMRLAEICLQRDLVICSDEVHCDLLLDDVSHTPLASLDPEIEDQCITLMAPSKTFNLAGLGTSFAIVKNLELRQRLQAAAQGIVPYVNVLGYEAALAAYRDCDDWVQALRAYLRGNRDYALEVLAQLPSINCTRPEAGYLLWLDCRQLGIVDIHRFLIREARVALSDGKEFGPGGEGFMRLNFGCPRQTLDQGLERIIEVLLNAHMLS